ncbi:MAG: DNA primase [Anaerolineae bacterium]
MQKTGKNFKGLCPFHGEKPPSFVVFPHTGTWRCFGCGRGGDVFNFAMEYEGWDFRAALSALADYAGVELAPLTPQQEEQQQIDEHLLALLREAAEYYNRLMLYEDHTAHIRDYLLQQRGLSYDAVMDFQIGYAPDGWQITSDYLLGLGYNRDDLIEAGLLVVNDRGHSYERFRNRVMIPIRNPKGEVVGFGARALEKDAKPKYLNSPQNRLFDKSSLLYGFSLARRAIRETETAVIVEGYMDVIQAHQAGFRNVVAQMGTALTSDQFRLLSRYATRLILALDADAAGQMATDRGLETIEKASQQAAEEVAERGGWGFDSAEHEQHIRRSLEFDPSGMVRYENDLGFDIRVVVMPEGKDPDDIIRSDPDWWDQLINGALPIVTYVMNKAVEGQDLKDPKVKSAIVARLMPLINNVGNTVERAHYRQQLARLLKVPESALLSKPSEQSQQKKKRSRQQQKQGEPSDVLPIEANDTAVEALLTPTASREAFLIAALIKEPAAIYRVNRIMAETMNFDDVLFGEDYQAAVQTLGDSLAEYLVPADFNHLDHQAVFLAWEIALGQDEIDHIDALKEQLDHTLRQQVDAWLAQPLYALREGIRPLDTRLNPERVFEEVVQGALELRDRRLNTYYQELVAILEDMDNGGNSAALLDHLVTIKAIRTARQRLLEANHLYRPAARLSE